MERNQEFEIMAALCNYMGAVGLVTTFLQYREAFGQLDPVYFANDSNIVYVTEFREGKMIRDFLRGKLEEYQDESTQMYINIMINDWQNVVAYALMKIGEATKEQSQ